MEIYTLDLVLGILSSSPWDPDSLVFHEEILKENLGKVTGGENMFLNKK